VGLISPISKHKKLIIKEEAARVEMKATNEKGEKKPSGPGEVQTARTAKVSGERRGSIPRPLTRKTQKGEGKMKKLARLGALNSRLRGKEKGERKGNGTYFPFYVAPYSRVARET